jgi:hypothetical protein
LQLRIASALSSGVVCSRYSKDDEYNHNHSVMAYPLSLLPGFDSCEDNVTLLRDLVHRVRGFLLGYSFAGNFHKEALAFVLDGADGDPLGEVQEKL